MVCFGSSTRDVFVQIDRAFFGKSLAFSPGSKVEINDMGFFTGGGASNTAVGFSRLGIKTAIVSAVGKDEDGIEIKKELLKEGVGCSDLLLETKRTSYSVILTGFGKDRVILNYSGATALLDESKKITWEKISTEWFFISSLHGKGKLLEKIFLAAEIKKIKVAFNPGKKELELGLHALERLPGKIDVLLLNAKEALSLTGKASVEKNLSILAKHADIVAITDGKNRVFVCEGQKVFSKKPFDVNMLDSSGAGDAFNSGFVGALAKGKSAREALDWGIANSNSVIQFLGAKNVLLSEKGIAQFLKRHK